MINMFDAIGESLDSIFRYPIPGIAILVIDYLNGSPLLDAIDRISFQNFGLKNFYILLGIFVITIGAIAHGLHRLLVHEIYMYILDRLGLPSHYSSDAFGNRNPTDNVRSIQWRKFWCYCYRRAVSLRTRCHIWANQSSEKLDKIHDAHATQALMLGIIADAMLLYAIFSSHLSKSWRWVEAIIGIIILLSTVVQLSVLHGIQYYLHKEGINADRFGNN